MRIYFDLHRRLTIDGCLKLLSRVPAQRQASNTWVQAVLEAFQHMRENCPPPSGVVESLGSRLEGSALFVGPVPIDLSDPELVTSGLGGFYTKDVHGGFVDPVLLAVFKAHGRAVPNLPQGVVQWVETGRDSQGLAARIWALDDTRMDDLVPAILLQTNIDDMNTEFFGYLMERLLKEGARDVYFTPITMKKSRPAVMINVLVHPSEEAQMVDILFAETTTLGIRRVPLETWILPRSNVHVSTRYGPIQVKIGWLKHQVRSAQPEYEDCRQAAQNSGVPLRQVYEEALRIFQKNHDHGVSFDPLP